MPDRGNVPRYFIGTVNTARAAGVALANLHISIFQGQKLRKSKMDKVLATLFKTEGGKRVNLAATARRAYLSVFAADRGENTPASK